jgi:hypothetical protein
MIYVWNRCFLPVGVTCARAAGKCQLRVLRAATGLLGTGQLDVGCQLSYKTTGSRQSSAAKAAQVGRP